MLRIERMRRHYFPTARPEYKRLSSCFAQGALLCVSLCQPAVPAVVALGDADRSKRPTWISMPTDALNRPGFAGDLQPD